jgi:hypothetical protein
LEESLGQGQHPATRRLWALHCHLLRPCQRQVLRGPTCTQRRHTVLCRPCHRQRRRGQPTPLRCTARHLHHLHLCLRRPLASRPLAQRHQQRQRLLKLVQCHRRHLVVLQVDQCCLRLKVRCPISRGLKAQQLRTAQLTRLRRRQRLREQCFPDLRLALFWRALGSHHLRLARHPSACRQRQLLLHSRSAHRPPVCEPKLRLFAQ